MKRAYAALLLVLGAGMANAVVVNFDDLTGSANVVDGYGGITWSDNWTYYDSYQPPYNPSSDFTRIYTNYSLHAAGSLEEVTFSFSSPTVFNGAYFSGGYNPGVEFRMYDSSSNLLATSANLSQTDTPTWLASGYSGAVTTVGVYGYNGYYVMDDVTYGIVPEPASMLVIGAGLLGLIAQRRTR